jgi:hypothetical protein
LKSRPPALATWLFESLTRREHREALAGDLLEEYNRRRSDTWYWRQVLAAVVANFRTELRSRRVSVVFALVVCGVIPWTQLFLNKGFQSFLVTGIQLKWPGSFLVGIALISVVQSTILLAALIIFIASTNGFHSRRFWIGFCAALFVLAVGNTVVAILQVLPWPRPFFYYVVWRLPLFFSLIVSMWAASGHARQIGASHLAL